MDCKNFGIGLIILSITLFLGITMSEVLKLTESPENTFVEEKILTEDLFKDCVPADSDLKYHFVGEEKTKRISVKVKNAEAFMKFIDGGEIDPETEAQLNKIEKEAARHNSSFQTLVFVRKCSAEKESQ